MMPPLFQHGLRSARHGSPTWPRIAGLLACVLPGLLAGCGRSGDLSRPAAEPTTTPLRREVAANGVTLALQVAPSRPRLSDDVWLAIEIRADNEREVAPLEFGERLGDFRVREIRRTEPRYGAREDTYQYKLLLEPLREGNARLLPIAVAYRQRETDAPQRETDRAWQTLASPFVVVPVRSDLDAGNVTLDNASELAGPLELRRHTTGWFLGTLMLIALAMAGGIAWWWLRRRGHGSEQAALSPRELALRQLRELREQRWAERDVKEFFVRLTAIVRSYIERTTGITAAEQTTEEFLHEIGSSPRFTADDRLRLREFLQSADLVKFAGNRPAAGDVDEALARGRQFVERTGNEPTGAEPTGDKPTGVERTDSARREVGA